MDGWKGGKWECPLCSQEFMVEHALRIHLSKKHRAALGLEPSGDDARWARDRAAKDRKERAHKAALELDAEARAAGMMDEEADFDEAVRED